MTAFNIVRARPKPERLQEFLDYNRSRDIHEYKGMISFDIVDVGGGDYVLVGRWEAMDALVAARPKMIGTLDHMRDMLEDLGGDLGVTDPRSGEAVVSLRY